MGPRHRPAIRRVGGGSSQLEELPNFNTSSANARNGTLEGLAVVIYFPELHAVSQPLTFPGTDCHNANMARTHTPTMFLVYREPLEPGA